MVQHVETVSCDFLATECLCINLGGGSRYACINECAFPSSQVAYYSHRHVKVLLYIVLVTHTCQGEYFELEEGKIMCTSERSMMRRWSSPFPGWGLDASPAESMLACTFTSLLIDIFVYKLHCRAGKCCYYFVLCVRAVAPSYTYAKLNSLK